MTFELDLKPLKNGLDKRMGVLKPRLARELYREANDIMSDSKEIVPVDTGVLRNSGVVLEPVIDDSGVYVEFGYGGAAKAYAARQHEDLTLKHKEGKSAKFLEIPMLARLKGMSKRIIDGIRRG